MTGLMETIFLHSSTNLGRYNAITSIPLSTEERYRIHTEARKWLQEMVPWGTANPERWIERGFPTDRPNWDYNTEERKIQLDRYQTAIIQRIKRGVQRPMGMSKLAGIVQKGNQSPSEFYERLCDAYRLYTPMDPEATGSQVVTNSAFISQALPDIKRKLQKTEGVLSMSNSQLIEIADKVFRNRDTEIENTRKGIKTSREQARGLQCWLLRLESLPETFPPPKQRSPP